MPPSSIPLSRLKRLGSAYNIDLYGLGTRSASTVQLEDYYVGALDSTDATLIQDNFTPNGASGTAGTLQATNTAASAALLAYVQAQYTDGGAGQYVFLRLSPDFTGTSSNSTGFNYYMAEQTGTNLDPLLKLNVTPEPASLSLVLGSGLLLLRRRRAKGF